MQERGGVFLLIGDWISFAWDREACLKDNSPKYENNVEPAPFFQPTDVRWDMKLSMEMPKEMDTTK